MKKPPKPQPKAALPDDTRTLDDINVERGPARVKALREKFSKALDDPDMRAAMARYIQSLLRESQES